MVVRNGGNAKKGSVVSMLEEFRTRTSAVKYHTEIGDILADANRQYFAGNLTPDEFGTVCAELKAKGEEVKGSAPAPAPKEDPKPKATKTARVSVPLTDAELRMGDKIMDVASGVSMALTLVPAGIARGIFRGPKYLRDTKWGTLREED